MASLSKRGPKSWLLQWYDSEGHKRSMSLADIDKKGAGEIKLHVQRLVSSKKSGIGYPDSTAEWLGSIGNALSQKLAKVGLIEGRASATLEPFLKGLFQDMEKEWAPRTRQKHNTTRDYLVEFFKADKPLREVSEGDAEGFARWLRHEVPSVKSEATFAKHITNARVYFTAAMRRRLIVENPFSHIKISRAGREEFYHVTQEQAAAILEACPSSQWRLIFAFARYGGLRIPSELDGLEWSHVLWDQDKILIHSPKNARHKGKEKRFIPMFPELKTYLNEEWDRLDGKAGRYVITEHRKPNGQLSEAYLRKRMRLIIERAGVTPWDKLFQNLRSTRATELAETYPGHVAAAWLGHSVKVAQKHYWTTTDEHFKQATGGSDAQIATLDDSDVMEDSAPQMIETEKALLQALLKITQMPEDEGRIDIRELAKQGYFSSIFNDLQSSQDSQVAEAGLEPARGLLPTGF
ncbi:MAG: tyrosine-type recombinase/integrase [Pirellulaceae bacterium]